MKKTLLYAAIIFKIGLAFSQTWCPPGATWYYRVYQPSSIGFYWDGHVKLQVTGTVTLNNITCNDMTGVFTGIKGVSTNAVSTNTHVTLQTYENNRTVHIYNTASMQFDTIANFNALIGDKWLAVRLPFVNCTNNTPRFPLTVTDTGQVLINGVSLRQLTLSMTNQYGTYTLTMVERIMCTAGFLFPYTWGNCISDVAPLGNLVCYSDDGLPTYNPTSTVCEYIPTAVEKQSLPNLNLKVYPNPNDGNFHLEFQQPTEITIYNLLGEIAYSASFKEGGIVAIEAANIKQGVYILKAKTAEGDGQMKFIRQ